MAETGTIELCVSKYTLIQLFVLLAQLNNFCFGDDTYWTSRENSLELVELSSINKVSLVYVSSCSNTGSIRDDPYWTSRKNCLELIELSGINKVSVV